MLPVISEAGGEAHAGTTVESLLVDDDRVVGVRTDDGSEFHSDVVISSIGARETVDHLLPEGTGEDDWIAEIRSLPSGVCSFSMYLGFEGDIEAAGATRANHWIYPVVETDAVWKDAPRGTPPVMFVSFASLKDPNHVPGPQQRHSGELLVFTDWSTVARWADMPRAERGDEYAAFKHEAAEAIFALFESYFPDLAELVVFRELATPLSTVAVTGHTHGAFYGRDVTPERMLSDALRMKTPIKGLYFSGQDVASPGVPGAMWGGVLCAGSIDPRVFRHIR
jgi:all-trans-retinol 13,14-reductase